MDLTIRDSDFRFGHKNPLNLDLAGLELPLSDHVEEFRQRFLQSIGFSILTIGLVFLKSKSIVQILEAPVQTIKFIQLSPGEYFLSTVKIAFYGGLLFSIPFLISQILFYVLPGLTKPEKKIILPTLTASVILFSLGLLFAYYVLIPAALNFFIGYSESIIEPFWSFDQYFDFIVFLFYSTGVAFQVPIAQVLIGLTGIINGQQMLSAWRYVILAATIISAVLTPSTDPVTQLCLAIAIVFLYFTGGLVLVFYNF